MVEMANIREHCSWVHADRDTATDKAIDLTRMAVARIRRNEPLSQTEIPITKRALVIGGGIAGIQAALDIADAGYPVTLVERTPSIGGRMAQYDKTFPTLDCAACILTPKMVDCGSNPGIRILSYSEVEEVSGFVGNFEVKIRQRARSVDMEKCTGCGICYEKCPVKVSSEFEAGLGKRKADLCAIPAGGAERAGHRPGALPYYLKTGSAGSARSSARRRPSSSRSRTRSSPRSSARS